MAASKTSAPAPAKSNRPKAIKTKLVVLADDKGTPGPQRTRTYEVQNAATGTVLGTIVEAWATKEMEYKNSVTDGRRVLTALDASGKTLGKDYGSRALTVAAIRKNAQ